MSPDGPDYSKQHQNTTVKNQYLPIANEQAAMTSARQTYHAFLLRLQRDRTSGPWRASLQDPRTRRLLNFASLSDLLAYLEQCTGERWQTPPTDPSTGDIIEPNPNAE